MISTEKERIFSWAKECGAKNAVLRTAWESDKASYFDSFSMTEDIYEYGFKNLSELKDQLQKLWNGDKDMEKIVMTCAVAAFKEKPEKLEKIRGDGVLAQGEAIEIRDYVYEF